MKHDAAASRQHARSGWVPAALVIGATGVALTFHGVSVGDVGRFAAYCGLGMVLPGVLLWRMLVSRTHGTLVADAVFGTALALAVELVVYSVCAHLGHPAIAWVWPVVPLGVSLLPGVRPLVWRRGQVQPLWWSWGMGALVMLGVAVISRVAWSVAPLTAEGLRSPYVDIPYHVSLVGGLSRYVRTDLPFVEGEPMYYHWFTHAHLAAERHATGIEPIVLLSRLDMLLAVGIVLLGSAMVAQRVARSPLAGLVATAVLTTGGSAALMWPHFDSLFLNNLIYLSPTTPFACAILLGCVAISIELLDPVDRPPLTAWIAAVLLIVASSGAKGPALPVLLAGWMSLLLMALLLRRRVHWPALGLVVLGAVVFVAAQKVIYGGSVQGTTVSPFAVGNYVAYRNGLLEISQGGSLALRTTVSTTYVLLRLSCLLAVLGLFTPRVWRNPHVHFLVGAIVGGVGGMLLFDSATRNQIYFLLVTPVFVAAAAGWGLVELLRRVSAPVAVRVCVAFLVAGAVTSVVLLELPPPGFDPHGFDIEPVVSVGWFLAQPLIVLGVLVLIGVSVWLVSRRPGRRTWRHAAPLACASFAIGLGLLTGPAQALDLGSKVRAGDLPSDTPAGEIAPGGISAATWLREHSSPDDVVATNSHCRFPAPRRCDHRAFWISAYSERQMLVEGWSYTSRSSELSAKTGVPVPFLSYWKPDVLMANERAFLKPTRDRLNQLRRKHHVRWLFVDKRFGVDLAALERLADLRLDRSNYAVFRLD